MEAQTGEAPSAGVTHDLAQAWVGPSLCSPWSAERLCSADSRWSHVRSWVLGEARRNLEQSQIWRFSDFLMQRHQEGCHGGGQKGGPEGPLVRGMN